MEVYAGARKRVTLRQKKRTVRTALLVFLACAAFFAAVLYAAAYSPLFRIRTLTVSVVPDRGAEQTVQEEIEKEISALPLARLFGTRNMLLWDEKRVDNMLARHNEFQSAHIERNFFARSVTVVVVHREKFGIWCTAGSCFWFSTDGVLSAPGPRVTGNLLLAINDESDRPLQLGDKVLDDRLIKPIFSVFDFLGQADIPLRFFTLKPLYLEELWAVAPSGDLPEIYFSLRADPHFALSAVSALQSNPGFSRIRYIDLRVPGKLYYKTK